MCWIHLYLATQLHMFILASCTMYNVTAQGAICAFDVSNASKQYSDNKALLHGSVNTHN